MYRFTSGPYAAARMKLEAHTIEELFEAAGAREADLREVDRLIVEAAPELKRQLFAGPSITMLGYGEMSWKNATSVGVWPLLGVAPQKQSISIYVAAERDGETLAQAYQKRLGKTQNGKHCIRFRRLADIDPEQLQAAVRDAIAWAEVQERMYGRACARPVEEH